MVDKCVQDLQQNFKDGLEDKCRVGAANVGFYIPPYFMSAHRQTFRLQMLQSLLLMNLRPPCIGLPIEQVSPAAIRIISCHSSTHL